MDYLDNGSCTQDTAYDKSQWLHYAVETQNWAFVRFLLDEFVDTEEKDVDGRTPLDWAIILNNPRIMQLLVDKKASISEHVKTLVRDQKINNFEVLNVLLFRSLKDTPTLIKPILENMQGSRKLEDTDYCIQLLHEAACQGTIRDFFASSIIQHQTLNQPNQQGESILYLLVQTLLDFKAELHQAEAVEIKDFLESKINNIKESIRYLIHQGSDINKLNTQGQSPRSLLETLGKEGAEILSMFNSFEPNLPLNKLLRR